MGVLFDKGDRPATIEADRRNGFYSSSKEGFLYLRNKIKTHKEIKILNEDSENLKIELLLPNSSLNLKIEALYGDDVTLKLFRKRSPVSDLLLLKYDDIWLSQLITIDERAFLLKNNKNFLIILKDLLKRSKELRDKYNELINSEGGGKELNEITTYLLSKYSDFFNETLVPKEKERDEYLGDIIQVLCASEA